MYFEVFATIMITSSVLGNQVIQNVSEITVKKGDDIVLGCSYSGTKYVLIWYQQKPHQSLQLILHDESKTFDEEFAQRFSGHHDTEQKTFNLFIRRSQWSDTGTYYCALEYGTVCRARSQLFINSLSCKTGLNPFRTESIVHVLIKTKRKQKLEFALYVSSTVIHRCHIKCTHTYYILFCSGEAGL
ncbi:T cell receptor delta chain [Pelobates cultripes]|nr:T cell receptor delta chain [Pelobates cultripes]